MASLDSAGFPSPCAVACGGPGVTVPACPTQWFMRELWDAPFARPGKDSNLATGYYRPPGATLGIGIHHLPLNYGVGAQLATPPGGPLYSVSGSGHDTRGRLTGSRPCFLG